MIQLNLLAVTELFMDLMAEVVVAHLFPLDLNVHYLTYQAMLENVWTRSPFTMNVDEVNEH